MAKKVKVSLDDLDIGEKYKNVGVISKDELVKIRDFKFSGKQSKLPSLIARNMAEKMLNDLETGTWVDTSKMESDVKKNVINAFKKDFTRILRTAEKEEAAPLGMRIRVVDQGNKVSFFYDAKKKKDKNGPVRDKTENAKKKKK